MVYMMPMKRLRLAALCIALTLAAWVADLFTPQLFIAAILMNGPIALSGMALDKRLTNALIIFAEIANIVAGYLNGVQAHYQWDPIAIGDRALLAASFLLVGYLTTRAQEAARDAGSATERARLAASEKALRRALEAVRATLNVELVLRAIVREVTRLLDVREAMLILRASQLHEPDIYRFGKNATEISFERRSLEPAESSLLQRATDETRLLVAQQDDPVARMLLETHGAGRLMLVRIGSDETSAVLFLFADEFGRAAQRLVQAFADGAAVALEQANLFMQLGFRNAQIAAQKDTLERRNRVIRDIVYALAHDLRTPLNAANVTMQQALEGRYGRLPDGYGDVLKTTIASNADARSLVDALLLVARLESGESSTLKEPVALRELLKRVRDELRAIAEAKGITVENDAGDDIVVTGDAVELRRAVTNLVANAIEATPSGGSVAMSVQGDSSGIRINVKDDGSGVPPERRTHLFERFRTGNRDAGGGSGLGLYIVRLIAEKYGGHVEYAPCDPRGSRFTIVLPPARQPARV